MNNVIYVNVNTFPQRRGTIEEHIKWGRHLGHEETKLVEWDGNLEVPPIVIPKMKLKVGSGSIVMRGVK